jgi:hypothetical protein
MTVRGSLVGSLGQPTTGAFPGPCVTDEPSGADATGRPRSDDGQLDPRFARVGTYREAEWAFAAAVSFGSTSKTSPTIP